MTSILRTSLLQQDLKHHWEPPSQELLKCNFDASYIHNSEFLGVGWVLRDESGTYKLFASSKLKQGTNPLEA